MHSFTAYAFLAAAAGAAAEGISVTPHDSYSSSVGVPGCKINTNRVAYWPMSIDCNDICVKLTYQDRSVNLLRIDQSGGAYDISYDAWNYLQTGESATTDPIQGGGVDMEYETVDASECADLIYTDGNKLPLSASNSMNFVSSCMSDSSSWVGQNYVLYNIVDSVCAYGYDETCTLDLSASNQASCPHTLGSTTPLENCAVYNIEYPSGNVVDASSSGAVSSTTNSLRTNTTTTSNTTSSSNGTSPSASVNSHTALGAGGRMTLDATVLALVTGIVALGLL